MPYATRADCYAIVAADAFVSRPRNVVAVDKVANVMTLPSHGFVAGQILTFILEGNATPGAIGMPTGNPALPSGLSASLTYAPIVVSSDLFQVAALPNGPSPVPLITSGAPMFGVRIDSGWFLDQGLENASGDLDEVLTAYGAPLLPDPTTGKYPRVIRTTTARLAIIDAISALGIQHPEYARSVTMALSGWEDRVRGFMASWVQGKPTNPEATDQNDVPDDGAVATNSIMQGRTPDMAWVTGML